MDNQPVQELHGTYADAVFRKLHDGRNIVNCRHIAEDAPRPERIVDHCTAAIQLRMHDMREAIAQRRAIKKRVERLYNRYAQQCNDDDQLIRHILTAYYNSRRKLPSRAQTATFVRLLSGFQ